MFTRIGFTGFSAVLVALASWGCSSGNGENGDAGGAGGSPGTTDSAIVQTDTGGAVPAGGRDSAADTMDCTPFSPPIPCAQGTACPTDSYCDFTQSTPTCTKYHCLPIGSVCSNDGFCMSGLCLSGVCSDPVGEGVSCSKQPCAPSLYCIGFPPTCRKQSGIGEACQDDSWCVGSITTGSGVGSADAVYCLTGVCGQSSCTLASATGCSDSASCPPGSDCLIPIGMSGGKCVQLYCGTDGMPCSKDAHCVSGFGCVSNHCRKLNVPLHCAGTPLVSDCSGTHADFPYPGCTVVGSSCSGTATDCGVHGFEVGGSGACLGQSGCTWDPGTKKCVGTPTPCSHLSGTESTCSQYNGCTPSLTTAGSPTPCAQVANDQCRWQPGCELTDVGIY